MMFPEERKMEIVNFVNEHKKATVAELCDYFEVSSATIRNDLRELEREKLLVRTHGGAMLMTKTGYEFDPYLKQINHLEEKQTIARLASALIDDGDTIILDTGTTTLELARLLEEKRDLTVVTDLAVGAGGQPLTDRAVGVEHERVVIAEVEDRLGVGHLREKRNEGDGGDGQHEGATHGESPTDVVASM